MRSAPGMIAKNRLAVATVSTLPPMMCGIASFAWDLNSAIDDADLRNYALHYGSGSWDEYEGAADVGDTKALSELARAINQAPVSVVNLQHEFGIWGGSDGENLAHFLEYLQKPVVATFHTTYDGECPPIRLQLLKVLADRSETCVVLTEASQRFLLERLFVAPDRIRVLPHGVPVIPYFAHRYLVL